MLFCYFLFMLLTLFVLNVIMDRKGKNLLARGFKRLIPITGKCKRRMKRMPVRVLILFFWCWWL